MSVYWDANNCRWSPEMNMPPIYNCRCLLEPLTVDDPKDSPGTLLKVTHKYVTYVKCDKHGTIEYRAYDAEGQLKCRAATRDAVEDWMSRQGGD